MDCQGEFVHHLSVQLGEQKWDYENNVTKKNTFLLQPVFSNMVRFRELKLNTMVRRSFQALMDNIG